MANSLLPHPGPGAMQFTVEAGTLWLSGSGVVLNVPKTVVDLAPNLTHYVMLDLGLGVVLTNQSGFYAGSYPIAIVVTGDAPVNIANSPGSLGNSRAGISSWSDNRPEVIP